jgi:hypothetical protein
MPDQRKTHPDVPKPSSVLRGSVKIRDIDQYNEFMSPVWEVVRDQLSPGSLRIENTFVSSRNSILYLESTKAAYSVRGKVPEGHVVFGVPIGPARAARWWGTGYPESSIPYALGGGSSLLPAFARHLSRITDCTRSGSCRHAPGWWAARCPEAQRRRPWHRSSSSGGSESR